MGYFNEGYSSKYCKGVSTRYAFYEIVQKISESYKVNIGLSIFVGAN